MIVFTIVPGNAISDLTSVASKIVALDPEEPGKPLKVLTGDFSYASHPQISYDGKTMLFEGRKNGNDPVQIWKMDLRNSKTTRITGSKQNCTGAVWLPGDKIVFNSKSGNNSQHALFTCKADGSGISRITFDPYILFTFCS
jgi:Tol biopolymer transport system component